MAGKNKHRPRGQDAITGRWKKNEVIVRPPTEAEIIDEGYKEGIVRGIKAIRRYNLDPLYEVVSHEALFLLHIVQVAREKDASELKIPELAKVADQISRSIDTIIRTMEFAQGRADSRPELMMQQGMLELLSDEELEKVELMYAGAEARKNELSEK